MEVLEKILKEIESTTYPDEGIGCGLEDVGITDRYEASAYGWDRAIEMVAEIIKNHMEDDDWTPCNKRLPNKEEFLKDDGRFILDDGNRRYQGLFDIYDGKFKFSKHISGIHYELFEDKCVIAWQPLPKKYKGEK